MKKITALIPFILLALFANAQFPFGLPHKETSAWWEFSAPHGQVVVDSGLWVKTLANNDANKFVTTDAYGRLVLGDVTGGGTVIDTTVNWSVLDSLNTPPVSPALGDIYEVGTSPTGAWAGHATEIATWDGVEWSFETPNAGNQLLNIATDIVSRYSGTTWVRVGKLTIHQGLDSYNTQIKIGSRDNNNLGLFTHNIRRILIANTGAITFNSAYTFPTTDGTSGYALVTNGSGQVSWQAVAGGGTSRFGYPGEDITANENRDFDGNGYNFNQHGFDTLIHSSDVLLKDAATHLINQGFDTSELLSNKRIIISSDTTTNYAATQNWWGKNSSLGFKTDATAIYANGLTFSSNPTRKLFTIDTTNGKLNYGIATPLIGGTGLTSVSTGDILYGSNTNTYSLLSDVSAGSYLRSGGIGTAPLWSTVKIPNTSTAGDIWYASDANTISPLAIGVNNQVLTVVGGSPTWATASASPWTRGAVSGQSATLNNVYTTNSSDTVIINTGSSGLFTSNKARGLFNVGGTSFLNGVVSTGGNIDVYSSNFGFSSTHIGNGNIAVGTTLSSSYGILTNATGSSAALKAFHLSAETAEFDNWSGSTGTSSYANGSNVMIQLQTTSSATTANHTNVLAKFINRDQGDASQTSGTNVNVLSLIQTKSSSTTPITQTVGFQSDINKTGGGTQQITTHIGFHSKMNNSGSQLITTGGNAYQFYADSVPSAAIANASGWGYVQKANNLNNFKNVFEGNTLIGAGTQSASAVLEAKSTTQGFLPPRMTTTQRDAIASPDEGLIIYNTTTHKLNVYTGAWEQVTSL